MGMSKQDDNFKGFWIDRDEFLDTELKFMEKMMLTSIKQLAKTSKGCFASNNYFADLFDITPGRASQLINSLKAKGYIKVKLTKDGKITTGRSITVFKKLNRVYRKLKGGIKYSKRGYLIYCEGINKDINNKEDNNKDIAPSHGFDQWYELYPRKKSRSKALEIWKRNKLAHQSDSLIEKLQNQVNHCSSMNGDIKYIKYPTTYLNAGAWDDDIEPIQEQSHGQPKSIYEQTMEAHRKDCERIMGKDENELPNELGADKRLRLLQ